MGGERAVQKSVEGNPGGRGDRGRSILSSMDDVELELRGIWVLTEEEQELWAEQNGHLL
jgi:hypothetical protein